jgi:hypothetical protein
MNMYNYFLKAAVSLRTLSSLVTNLFTQLAIVLELALVSLHCSLGEGTDIPLPILFVLKFQNQTFC